MNTAKKKKLRAAGWQTGATKDFLNLSPEEALLVEIRLALATALKRERQRRRWTQSQLAEFLGTSQSRLAKMEASDPSVSIDLLVTALVRLGITKHELAHALRSSGA